MSEANVSDRPLSLDETRFWRAVVDRDPSYDGRFVFGVRSTHVYCRPSCPARRPRRSQVLFFGLPEAAEGAGFRSCLRCRPREVPSRLREAAWIRRVCQRIDEQAGGSLSLDELSRGAGVSPHHLQRRFKRLVGLTPRQYAEARRLEVLKTRLKKGEHVTTALYESGFGSSSRLYESSSARLGMTPATYRRGGRGARMAFALVASPLGRLLVAATERGVSMVALGDSDSELQARLRTEYPQASIELDAARLRPWVEAILGQLRGEAPSLALPLDLRATAFQWRVWRELQAIPRGATRSYGEVARRIGRPSAVRAVARACATNPAALVIPCHRVVPAAGGVGGYRWGSERKRELLRREGSGGTNPGRAGSRVRRWRPGHR